MLRIGALCCAMLWCLLVAMLWCLLVGDVWVDCGLAQQQVGVNIGWWA